MRLRPVDAWFLRSPGARELLGVDFGASVSLRGDVQDLRAQGFPPGEGIHDCTQIAAIERWRPLAEKDMLIIVLVGIPIHGLLINLHVMIVSIVMFVIVMM